MKVGPDPFLQPNSSAQSHLPEIHEMTEDLGEEDLDNMTQEELDATSKSIRSRITSRISRGSSR